MTSIWKFNSQDLNGRECEYGVGDGGYLIYADTADEALDKLYERWEKQSYLECLPDFYDDEIHWDTYIKDEWKN